MEAIKSGRPRKRWTANQELSIDGRSTRPEISAARTI
jgi:hypothetical protein